MTEFDNNKVKFKQDIKFEQEFGIMSNINNFNKIELVIKKYPDPIKVCENKHNSRKLITYDFKPKKSLYKDLKSSPVFKTTVQNIDLNCVRPSRAGVIIYTVYKECTYFGLGLDSKTHDLTDFGGTVIYSFDKDVIRGALREFDEEILQIIKPITYENIRKCPVIYNDKNLIIFVHINVNPEDFCKYFNQKCTSIINSNKIIRQSQKEINIKDPEVCGITWLTWEEFSTKIKEKGAMFSRVQKFLHSAGDFSYLL